MKLWTLSELEQDTRTDECRWHEMIRSSFPCPPCPFTKNQPIRRGSFPQFPISAQSTLEAREEAKTAPECLPALEDGKQADLIQDGMENLHQLLPGMGEPLPQVSQQPSVTGRKKKEV